MQDLPKEAALSEEEGGLRKSQGEHFDRIHLKVSPETRVGWEPRLLLDHDSTVCEVAPAWQLNHNCSIEGFKWFRFPNLLQAS